MLGEYGNGGANSLGRYEYIWLPTEDGSGAIPIGLYKSGKFFAVHADHLGTPRIITDDTNTPVWQWPYSAFGESSPTGVLALTNNTNLIYTQDPTSLNRLKLTTPGVVYNLRHDGQYADSETGLFYNYFRTYDPKTGRYTQNDPIGLGGGLNRFGYVGGNALSFVDPRGENLVAIGALGLGLAGLGIIEMSRPKPDAGPISSPSPGSGSDQCCPSYTDVYDVGRDTPKHGSTQIGDRGAEPSNPELALQNSVGTADWKLGYDGLAGQIVMFRNQRTDEKKCIKYWHGYVVYQQELTAEQWRAGRAAGFPKWPRKPGQK